MNKSEFITILEKNRSIVNKTYDQIINCEINREYLNTKEGIKTVSIPRFRSVTLPESNIYVATALFRTCEDHYVQEIKKACLDILAAIEEKEKKEAEEDEEIMKGEEVEEGD